MRSQCLPGHAPVLCVLSKSYDASNAGNSTERCRLQHKMRSDVYDRIAAGSRSLSFCDRIPHSAFAKGFRSFASSLYLARRDRRALFSTLGYILCRSKPVDQRCMIFFKISVAFEIHPGSGGEGLARNLSFNRCARYPSSLLGQIDLASPRIQRVF